jgi:tRNA (guanine37-N1)-methyltransferase
VVGQAVAKQKIAVDILTPRTWTHDIHKTVDDRPFGGGDGMVMMAEPLSQCLEHTLEKAAVESNGPRRIFLSPQGKTLDHNLVMELAQEKHLLLLCGRYAGVDQRLLNHYHFEEVSIGDFVLSGGELGALVIIDAVGRQLEGVLGHEASSTEDSFANNGLLEAPCYTRPREWKEYSVPDFLLTGNHAQIAEDRWFVGVVITFVKRRDLFDTYMLKQDIKRKVWQRSFAKLQSLTNNALTSLGLTRKNLEDFENQLKKLKVL